MMNIQLSHTPSSEKFVRLGQIFDNKNNNIYILLVPA